MAIATAYEWREGFSRKASPEAVGRRIEDLGGFDRDRGVTPGDLVDDAGDGSSPLHGLFTWDDERAAGQWRNAEARSVLRNIRRVVVDTVKETRDIQVAYISVKVEQGRRYLGATVVMQEEALSFQAVNDALKQLAGLRKRLGHLRELSVIWNAIDTAADEVGRLAEEAVVAE